MCTTPSDARNRNCYVCSICLFQETKMLHTKQKKQKSRTTHWTCNQKKSERQKENYVWERRRATTTGREKRANEAQCRVYEIIHRRFAIENQEIVSIPCSITYIFIFHKFNIGKTSSFLFVSSSFYAISFRNSFIFFFVPLLILYVSVCLFFWVSCTIRRKPFEHHTE